MEVSMKFVSLAFASVVSAHLLAAQGDPTSQEKFPSAQRDRNSPPRTQAEASASLRASGRGTLSSRDIKFLKDALRMGRRQVALSQDVAQRGRNPQVQVLAESIAKDHEATDDTLKAIAKKNGLDLTSEKEEQAPPDLSQTPVERLDDVYLEATAADAKEEIAEFDLASIGADNIELEELARRFAPTLRMHRERAQTLKK